MGGLLILIACFCRPCGPLDNVAPWIAGGNGLRLHRLRGDYLKLKAAATLCRSWLFWRRWSPYVSCWRFGAFAARHDRFFVPFLKDVLIDFGLGFVLVGLFVIVGASNAVNLTDGLDGLAIVPSMIAVPAPA